MALGLQQPDEHPKSLIRLKVNRLFHLGLTEPMMAQQIKWCVLTLRDGDWQIKRLEHVLINWANIPSGFDHKTIHEPRNATALVLAMNGIHDYLEEFVTMTYKELEELQSIKEDDGTVIKISKEGLWNLKLIILHHHNASSRLGEVLDLVITATISFILYRETIFREDAPLEVWEDKNPKPQCTTHEEKSVKVTWSTTTPKYQEVMKTLADKGLVHLLKEGHQPRGTVIDSKNQEALFQVLKETCVHPKCKRALVEHEHLRNMLCLWVILWATINPTIMDQHDVMIQVHQFMSTHMHDVIWKGTQTSYLWRWLEHVHMHSLINREDTCC